MSENQEKTLKHKTREDFCGACVSGLSALAGSGIAGGSTKVKNKKTKKIIFISGLTISIISILFMIYFIWIKKCKDCSV